MRKAILGGALAAALAIVPGCRRAPAPGRAAERPSVLFITIDTLRADRLGAYGHAGAATPTLDGLATRGARFETAIAHVPLTGPSHASMLTGLTPTGHGVRDNGGYVVPAEIKTAADEFSRAGYRTAAFVSGFPLDRRFGFNRGFATYDDHLPRGNDPRRTPYVERSADATTDAALRWLGAPETASAPFFLWVHYYDPHAPYEPPGELAQRFARAPYDGEIAFVDGQIARLLRALEDKGALARTLVLVTSDHGEGLGEHGEGTHGLFVYDSTLKVPWIMAGPGVTAGTAPSTVARGIDVFPTLLDHAGLPVPGGLDGRSLRPAVEGKEMADAPVYAESVYAEREFGWAPLFALRTSRYKLIEAPRPELYDLRADAGEATNLMGRDPARAEELRTKLRAALARPARAAAAQVDAVTAERLAALGYLGGGRAPGAVAAGPARRDPKDGVALMPRLNRGMSAARTDPPLAIRELRAVLAEDPGLLMARRTLAVAHAAAGEHDRAIAELRRLEKEGHLGAEDAIVLGDNLRFAGRLAEAAEVLRRAARDHPRFAQPWLSLAEVHIKEKENAEATAAYEHVLGLVPDHIEALRGLGDVALLEGRAEAAATSYGRILEVDPADAGAMTKLGVLRMRAGDREQAVALFRQAVEREPANGEALLYLAGALASSGRPAEALPFFERALAASPRSTMTLNGLALTRLALGDRKGAAGSFRESLRLDPEQPDVRRTLAEIGP
ncbi:MAG TPA: sulfatase-like hydrolase/transferase [Vicinamibacteria bacterium]|nr:sulfatase-like hydrolase/transferase [Vicinamibacteria bacterium]